MKRQESFCTDSSARITSTSGRPKLAAGTLTVMPPRYPAPEPMRSRPTTRLTLVTVLLSIGLHLTVLLWTFFQPDKYKSPASSKPSTAISAMLITTSTDIRSPSPSDSLKAAQPTKNHAPPLPPPRQTKASKSAPSTPNRSSRQPSRQLNVKPPPMMSRSKPIDSGSTPREVDPFSGEPSTTTGQSKSTSPAQATGSVLGSDLAGQIAKEIRSHLTPIAASVRTPVLLELTCQENTGQVTAARIAKSSGDWRWDDAARQAALASRIPQHPDGTRPRQFSIRVFP